MPGARGVLEAEHSVRLGVRVLDRKLQASEGGGGCADGAGRGKDTRAV